MSDKIIKKIVIILFFISVTVIFIPFKKTIIVVIDAKISLEMEVLSRPVDYLLHLGLGKRKEKPLLVGLRFCDNLGRSCIFILKNTKVFFEGDVRILSNSGNSILVVDSRGSETVYFEFHKMEAAVELEITTMASPYPVFEGKANLE